jgi:dynein heavy chain 1
MEVDHQGEEKNLPVELASPQALKNHLEALIPLLLLEGSQDDPLNLSLGLCEMFISDASLNVLFALKIRTDDPDAAPEAIYKVSLQAELVYTDQLAGALALVKRGGALIESGRSLNSQIQVITLNADNVYESIHSILHNAVAPLFDAYIGQKSNASLSLDPKAGISGLLANTYSYSIH